MALLPLSPGVYLFASAVNSLIVAQGGRALIVDTGLDDSHARKLLRAVQELGLSPSAVLNTHSHADHHGGNAFILSCFAQLPLYAPPLEAAMIQHPLLEPLTLYGAAPPAELRSKFLLAPASPAQAVGAGHVTLGGVDVELINVPGHAQQMYALRVGGLLYAADALFSPATLNKHPLTFCVDSAAMKRSAQMVLDLPGIELVAVGHGEPTPDLCGLVAHNLAAHQQVTQAVLAAVQAPASVDEVLRRVCHLLGLSMTTPAAVMLNRAAVSAHLSELAAQAKVTLSVQDNALHFGAT